MLRNIGSGFSSRKILTVAAALFVVAIMLAVPLFAVDTDAAIQADSAGFSLKMENPSNDDLTTYHQKQRAEQADTDFYIFMKIFNIDNLVPTFGSDTYNLTVAEGKKYSSDSFHRFFVEELSATGIEMVYTFDGEGFLINPATEYYTQDYQMAALEIESTMDTTVHNGDMLKITGSVDLKELVEYDIKFAQVNDTKSVETKETMTKYEVVNINVQIEFLRSDSTSVGKIGFHSNNKYMLERVTDFDFGSVQIADLTESSKCTITHEASQNFFESGDMHYTISEINTTVAHEVYEKEVLQNEPVDLQPDSDRNLVSYKEDIEAFPVSAGCATVVKTYESAEEIASEVAFDAAGEEVVKILLLVAGVAIAVIAIIVILIIVLIVLKKKKK